MNKKIKNHFLLSSKGYTLVELLIYLVLFSTLLLVVTQFLFETKTLELEINNSASLNRSTRALFSEIKSSLRNAQLIDLPARGASGNSLSLNNGQIIFSLNDQAILEKKVGSETYLLHSSQTKIEELSFTRGNSLGQKENIQIKIKVKGRSVLEGQREKSLFLQTTIALR